MPKPCWGPPWQSHYTLVCRSAGHCNSRRLFVSSSDRYDCTLWCSVATQAWSRSKRYFLQRSICPGDIFRLLSSICPWRWGICLGEAYPQVRYAHFYQVFAPGGEIFDQVTGRYLPSWSICPGFIKYLPLEVRYLPTAQVRYLPGWGICPGCIKYLLLEVRYLLRWHIHLVIKCRLPP